MVEQRHRIRRQVLELRVRDAVAAQRLHAEISRIQSQRIAPLLDRCLSELSAPDRLHRIETLELDLGNLDPDNLEEDLVSRLGAKLRSVLAEHIDAPEQPGDGPETSPEVGSQLELFAVFARTGSLPWWADLARPDILQEAMQSLIQSAPRALARLIRDLAREPQALRRIVLHADDGLLSSLCGILVPSLDTSFESYPPQLRSLLKLARLTAASDPAAARRIVWREILRKASLEGPGSSDALSFWREVLTRIAIETGSNYESLLSALRGSAERLATERSGKLAAAGLRDLLGELYRELPVGSGQSGRSGRGNGEGPRGPESRARGLDAEQADALRRLGNRPTEDHVPLDLAFSETDELYVENAGLVLLWPFLARFFEHLGFLEAKRFRDEAAVQRAVGLLQYIAAETPSPPEFLLPLNKLVCGMGLSEVFDFGEPVTEAEAEECGRLLEAVIEQAPILRKMSVQGFRGSFLLRKGVLSSRDGAWLLSVERETYDVVLDRFPWSIAWVKLPWMEAPLRVEW